MKRIISAVLMVMYLFVATQTFAKSQTQVSGVVNVNTATKAELVLIPGIGEAKADAIISQRQIKAFSNKEDLLAVKGIGEKMLEKLASYVTVNGQTTIKVEKVSQN